MKNICLIVGFIFSIYVSKAQTKDSLAIATDVNLFFNYTTTNQVDSLLEMLYPKLFTIAPKEQLKQQMKNMLDDKNLTIKMFDFKIKSISPTFLYNTVKYALVKYNFRMTMQFGGINESQKNNLALQYSLPELQEKFGKSNVQLNDETQTISIYVNGLIYAINEPKKSWKFLEKKEEQKALLNYLLPQAVINKLK